MAADRQESEALLDKPGVGRVIALAAGPLVFLVLALLTPAGLTPAGARVLGVAAWMTVWWLTGPIPLGATALLPLVLFPVLGVASPREAATPYANEFIFLFLAGFMLAAALEAERARLAQSDDPQAAQRLRALETLDFDIMVGSLAFWFEDVFGFDRARALAARVLSGGIVPLVLLLLDIALDPDRRDQARSPPRHPHHEDHPGPDGLGERCRLGGAPGVDDSGDREEEHEGSGDEKETKAEEEFAEILALRARGEGLRAQWGATGLDYDYILGKDWSKFPANSFVIRRSDFESSALLNCERPRSGPAARFFAPRARGAVVLRR